MLFAIALALAIQNPDPALAEWHAAITTAQSADNMQATVGRLVGTDDRVVLCTLDGSVTRLRCYHSTQRMVNGVWTVNHSEPSEHAGEALADVLVAERAWANGG